ncbi:MAG: hypothetical protein GPJ21_19870 [Microcystis aeruginosa W13-11]|jgi:hypothetical protein|nr:hypothetical protein [Microcystis aeruginosa W13-11]
MNNQLVKTLAQIIRALSEEEKQQLERELTSNGAVEAIKSHQELSFCQTATPEEWIKAFEEWAESHRDKNFPQLSDQDISRESIYGERG